MSDRPAQSYANHTRFVPGFHYLLTALLLVALVGAVSYFYKTLIWGQGRTQAGTVLLLVVACGLLGWYTRTFALRAQDRAIRAEESLRHYVLTGKLLDPRLRVGQVIALRFASDEELPELARRACEEGLGNREIKQAIKSWRPDHHRV
jgi:hypothetical protein